MMETTQLFSSVYGPVDSWRYGKSLGIDPIGAVSTCSFNCAYCQLGEIEQKTAQRAIFIPTEKIIADLQDYAPWDVDIITLSGSGEPTLALNLGEILEKIKIITSKPTLVLTNATLLHLAEVRADLALAGEVSVKLDAVTEDQLRRVDRPVEGINLEQILKGIRLFAQEYQGKLTIQTMILYPWTEETTQKYIETVQDIAPATIHLNTPKRPKPLKHELDARGNHTPEDTRSYPVQILKCVSSEILEKFANQITQVTKIPVSVPVT
jgi:wyosine [tRNA(Phe)-imidazoG37] synthetase (radical SAM superfamily)